MKRIIIFIACCSYLTIFQVAAQELDLLIQRQLNPISNQQNISTSSISEWIITDHYTSEKSGVQHIYIRQQYQGIEIIGANATLHLTSDSKQQKVLNFNNNFIPRISSNINVISNVVISPTLSALQAVDLATRQLGYSVTQPIEIIRTFDNIGRNILLSDAGISLKPIPAKLVFQKIGKSILKLAWDISILELSGENWWSIRIDATTGEILEKNNWVIHCHFGHFENCSEPNNSPKQIKRATTKPNNTILAGNYNVFPVPVESPNHGNRTIINTPFDPIASPYGWHDIDGQIGAEYTITRGNNVHTYEDNNDNPVIKYSPDGGANLNFNFPIDLSKAPIVNQDANITNLFYWNNIIHDVAYHLGFDEASGNFQENNYGKGGLASDYVLAEAQDGGGLNNATFAAPPDGNNPLMQMYLWSGTNPKIDGSLDNGIVLHEYGHGISVRLTGGPSNSNCLNNLEQMGEGWSDFWGLILTMKNTDVGSDVRGIGTYALSQGNHGNGIRTYPYSTDMSINPHTYNHVLSSNLSVPHGIGSVWCAMLWEMTWELINKYGFDDNFYEGAGGNNIAMQLVMEGLKLQPCSPGFVDARDAILKADTALYDGNNSCLIWKAFAKRGLGYSANQGSSNNLIDGTADFSLPPSVSEGCAENPNFSIVISPKTQAKCPNGNFIYEVSIIGYYGYSGTVNIATNVLPNGLSSQLSQTSFNTFPAKAIWTVSNTQNLQAGNYTINIGGTDGVNNNESYAILTISPSVDAPTLISPANNAKVSSLMQNLQWNVVDGANSYDLQLATDNSFNDLIIDESRLTHPSFTTNKLAQNTTYYWRVRSNSCAISDFNQYSFTTVSSCGQPFTDSGGANGYYKHNELLTFLFCPDNIGSAVSLVFSSFDIESKGNDGCWDDLKVYNGDNLEAPLLGTFCGTTIADAPGGGTITATNPSGCLTFVFHSDNIIKKTGWAATVNCIGCANPIISDVIISPENCLGTNDGSIIIISSALNPIEYVLTSNMDDTLVNTTGIFSNLAAGTYTAFLRKTADYSCISNTQTILLTSTNPTINEIEIINGDCENINKGRVRIFANFRHPLEYILTTEENVATINTSGNFSNLVSGNYTAQIRMAANKSCVSMDSSILIKNRLSASPSTTEDYEMCFSNALENERGVAGNCGLNICNALTIQPNQLINAAQTSVCETITINESAEVVSEIWLSVKVQHGYIGDLSATLESPDGTLIQLFDRPGTPPSNYGCTQNNLKLIFADTAASTATDLENTCQASNDVTTYAIEGSFQPINLFATFNGEKANGDWTICFYDSYAPADHGLIEAITLAINPTTPILSWWDAPIDGNLLKTGPTFNPVGSELLNLNQKGQFTYWSQCDCIGCPSERIPATFTINGDYYYLDKDQDGYGSTENTIVVCPDETPPTDYVSNHTDCNDDNNADVIMAINDYPIAARIHQANEMITSKGIIIAGDNLVTFKAANEIRLLPGFKVASGGQFLAKIDSCGPQISSFSSINNVPDTSEKTNLISIITPPNIFKPISLKAFPNPFKNNTTISFQLIQKEKISLIVFDSFGRLVKTLYNKKWKPAGDYQVTFEGNTSAPGVFIIVLKTASSISTKRMVLTR